MRASNLPGFKAEAALYRPRNSYRSQMTRADAGHHSIVAQRPAAASDGLVVPAWKVVVRCSKDREGHWECEKEEVM